MPEPDDGGERRLPCAGFVLAGGRSTRMGQDKALLRFDGETLLERGLRQLGAVAADVAIAGGAPELAGFGRRIPDAIAGLGPLGGLVAALEQSAYAWNLFVPVDVPFVPSPVWRSLFDRAEGSDCGAVLASAGGRAQPLCGFYARSALGALRESLSNGRLKIADALQLVGDVHLVPFENKGWFRNLNTPEDYGEMLATLAGAPEAVSMLDTSNERGADHGEPRQT